jgi:hypothetical protein
MRPLALILFLGLLTGCGPLVSGTWSDDPKNWKRAFGESRPPDGISIVHSWYMRTPHFTTEYAWFFQLELSDKMKKELVSSSELSKLPPLSLEDFRSRTYHDRPSWFSPQPLSAYDAYASKAERDFLILLSVLHDSLPVMRKTPNKAPEPTPTAVTSRAIEIKSETKLSNPQPYEARVAPAVVVAHL